MCGSPVLPLPPAAPSTMTRGLGALPSGAVPALQLSQLPQLTTTSYQQLPKVGAVLVLSIS